MQIVEVTRAKGALCAEILAALPNWFGLPESNAGYIRDVEDMPMFTAVEGGESVGFIALKPHSIHAVDIHVLGVKPLRHRQGAGRALVEAAIHFTKDRGARFLTVQTLSEREPDAGYARTRAFYAAMGFLPICEFPEKWSPGNPQVMMILPLT